ncbi:hypothetical protein BCON_1217g00010 [Botryotinia convoluta]|uniref:Uncharacterized protein n=1 Tax=Botryotinia convoluta TaxID=54673 RepID=A0A4Z1H351_9HELO|nr:hypothetical protein BCON_1217g00010 [Botryotinia convoluta]
MTLENPALPCQTLINEFCVPVQQRESSGSHIFNDSLPGYLEEFMVGGVGNSSFIYADHAGSPSSAHMDSLICLIRKRSFAEAKREGEDSFDHHGQRNYNVIQDLYSNPQRLYYEWPSTNSYQSPYGRSLSSTLARYSPPISYPPSQSVAPSDSSDSITVDLQQIISR